MITIESLKEEIDLLKKNQDELIKKISDIEKSSSSIKIQETEEQESPVRAVVGIILILVGLLLIFSFFGVIIGVPLLIWGIVLVSRRPKRKISEASEVKEKIMPPETEQEVKVIAQSYLKKEKATLEEGIGMEWFARIGILALVIGVGFFVKYAIDMNWINHLTRIIMGAVFGMGLILFGEIISKKEKYINWAKTLVGGGFAITYFVIFAAYHFPEYQKAIGISQALDIILLSLVVVCAILFSLKDNSQIIAGGSFFLGYITSLLSNDFGFMTIIYGLLLTIGLVVVVSYKKWSIIGLGGLVASYMMYILWYANNSYSFAYTSFILISYFIAFTAQSFFLARKKEISDQNIAIVLINSALFFILYYFQIDKYYPDYTGLFTLIMSIFYFSGYLISQVVGEAKFSAAYLYLALLYITLTIPVQLNKELVTIAWSLETLVLTALFIKTNVKTLKVSSYIVGIITGLKTIFYDTVMLNGLDFVNPINSTRLLSFLSTIICFYIIYKLLKANKGMITNDESAIPLVYSWIASGLLVLIIFIELFADHVLLVSIILSVLALLYILLSNSDKKEIRYQSFAISSILFFKVLFYDSWSLKDFNIELLSSSTRFFAFIIAIFTFYIISWYLENKKEILDKSEHILIDIYSYAGTILAFTLIFIEMEEFWISIGWSILALIIMVVGFSFRKKHLRMQGIIIFAITIAKVFLYDTRNLETMGRIISYMVLGVILLLVSFIYTKYREKLKEIL